MGGGSLLGRAVRGQFDVLPDRTGLVDESQLSRWAPSAATAHPTAARARRFTARSNRAITSSGSSGDPHHTVAAVISSGATGHRSRGTSKAAPHSRATTVTGIK
ncbi:hypothetical protein [Streptomyces sp. NPDC096311]|uniref:hypothetical protein n=1 Tax=Streptomyces sp. NPDC096311 TaxID=3366083 RepID=UPI00380C09D7